MPSDAAKPDEPDFFVSYARADNAGAWISRFVDELVAEHCKFFGGRRLRPFFDVTDIRGLDDWQQRIYGSLAASRLFLAFLSPRYFASEWCRREWRTWLDLEIAKHVLSAGAAPVYIVEVPGFDQAGVSEQQVARQVAELCALPAPHEAFCDEAGPVVRGFRRRQLSRVEPFYGRGIAALREEELRRVLVELAQELDRGAERVRLAALSPTTVPPYNKRFSGRMDELMLLRQRLNDNWAGVICGLHGLGGIGKTELAFAYAHAFASVYPGGRFLVPCEGKATLREAALVLGEQFRDRISEQDRMTPQTYFAAIATCLAERLDRVGHVLLVLDNVTDPALLTAQETDALTALGPKLHLLATTRLAPPAQANWLTLGELPEADAMSLLEKHRPFADEVEREAARRLVRRLGGFAMAVELAAAWLAAHPGSSYTRLVEGLGLEDLEDLATDEEVHLRRHHERRLSAVLGPVLEGLKPAEHRALEYAALLAPDHVPLPWLESLTMADIPNLGRSGRGGRLWTALWRRLVGLAKSDSPEFAQPAHLADPWTELWQRLLRLALFSRAEGEGNIPRVIRVHRLVQDLVRRGLSPKDLASRQQAVDQLVGQRESVLRGTTRWADARWELEPLDALATLWAETGHPWAAWLLNQAGQRWRHLAEWTRAEPLMRRAVAVLEQSPDADHPNVASALNNLAALLQATNRLAEAEPLMRRALVIDQQSFGADHPNVARDLNNLAQLLQATNRLAEAEPLMRRAMAIDQQSFGADHLNVAIRLNNLAQLLQATNRLAEAEPLIRRALVIDEQSLGADHPNVARDLNNLAGLLQATNRLAEAEPLYRRALAIDEQSFGADHPNVAIDLNNLAALLQDTNRLAEAEPLMRRALVIDQQSFGADHPNVARDLNNLAALLWATNRLAEAEPLSRRTVEIVLNFTRATGHEHPHLRRFLENYAELLQALGRSQSEVRAEIEALRRQYGVELDGGA